MRVYAIVKSLGKRRNNLEKREYDLQPLEYKVKDIITALVKEEVKMFTSEERNNNTEGKISFGELYGDRAVDINKAIEVAVQEFEDGLYRIFVDDISCEKLDEIVKVKDESQIVIIKLTNLSTLK